MSKTTLKVPNIKSMEELSRSTVLYSKIKEINKDFLQSVADEKANGNVSILLDHVIDYMRLNS